jgi:hypothetical protein
MGTSGGASPYSLPFCIDFAGTSSWSDISSPNQDRQKANETDFAVVTRIGFFFAVFVKTSPVSNVQSSPVLLMFFAVFVKTSPVSNVQSSATDVFLPFS